ncbi:MAG: HPr family phosphocarrier protein [Verrucomicrobia bacterium]|nr:HPr family phosphocarrier protein [Verrucomicrobiota bacterium]
MSKGLHTRTVQIRNEFGMHIRPASIFVKVASSFEADLTVEKDGNEVPGKSIFGLMTLEAAYGSTLNLTANGADAKAMLDRLEALVESRFKDEG